MGLLWLGPIYDPNGRNEETNMEQYSGDDEAHDRNTRSCILLVLFSLVLYSHQLGPIYDPSTEHKETKI